MRWKLTTAASMLVALAACTPDIPEEKAPNLVVARFDPAASPAVVPSPNDLALDPATGRPVVPPPPNPSEADLAFIAYLGTLDGFPAASAATATFTAPLDPATLNAQSIRVVDMTTGAPVAVTSTQATSAGETPITTLSMVGPNGGWESGHRYLAVVVGGANGVKGADGATVVGSTIWSFVRAQNSLVTCADLASSDCRRATALLPDDASAVRLETLRRAYAPLFDLVTAQGVARDDVALLWTFTIASGAAAVFDPAASPPRVPTPNDLAIDPTTGLVKAPVDPTASPAEQEFVRDYLNTLDGFPISAGATAQIAGGALAAATVSPATVRVIDTTDLLGGGTGATTATVAYVAASNRIAITPPATGWTKGHVYAVALYAGPAGLTNVDGVPLQASTAWALARSPGSLVTCSDLSASNCALNIRAAPLSLEQALGLERLRRGYAPLLDALDAMGVARENIPLLWTFRIVSQPEATFDPAGSVIPFPNNVLLNPTTGKVNLPGAGGPTLIGQLIAGLNTLDGFGLTSSAVSENSDTLGAVDVGEIDEATLATGAGFMALTPNALTPDVRVCLNCDSSLNPDGSTPDNPQQVQFVPNLPLSERTTYAAWISGGTKSTEGKSVVANPVFAFARSSEPLVDGAGKSQVSALSDAQAQALEPLRLGMKPLFDGLAAAGHARRDLALAFAYTTQSSFSVLQELQGVPTAATLPTAVTGAAQDATLTAALSGAGTVWTGRMITANLLAGMAGPFAPSGAPAPESIPFLLVVPTGAAPAGGWPVTIFGHGLTGGRFAAMRIAGTLAQAGQATIAIDTTHHGDRSDCRGAGSLLGAGVPDSAVCSTGTCSTSTGRCEVSAGVPGTYVPKSAADPTAVISGWNFIEAANLFATRDRFRQQVVDLSQVVRVVRGTGPGSLQAAAGALDAAQVTYVGQSLGGMLGTLFTAASPDVGPAVLNVPGGSVADILLTSPAFVGPANALKATLAANGLPQGSPGYDNFINIARWIMDPADPINAAYQLLNGPQVPAGRGVLLQYITEDQVIPNPTTVMLIDAANRGDDQLLVRLFQPSVADRPLAARHGFLLDPASDPTTTVTAQTQAATFVTTGTVP